MAGAEVVAGDPGAHLSQEYLEQDYIYNSQITAGDVPKYALKDAADTDGNAATAGYVKGAYNSIIMGLNRIQEGVDLWHRTNTTDDYANAVSHLLDNTATKTGTAATVNAATSTESIATSSVNISNVTTTSLSATASGNVNLSVPAMDNWANDSEATDPVAATTSFSGLTVNNISMNRPTQNTATLTKTGIGGTVSVSGYTLPFDFSTLNTTTNGTSNVAYPNTNTWSTTFSYGTVTGTAACSRAQGTARGATKKSLQINNTGQYCWCKMTEFDNGTTNYNQSSFWVYNGKASSCSSNCLSSCGSIVKTNSAIRSGMYGTAQNSSVNFATLNTSTNGTTSTSNSTTNTWSVEFSYGAVNGKAMCGEQADAVGETASTLHGEGYCWCKMTGFNDGNQTSAWVYTGVASNYSCTDCAQTCENRVRGNSTVRAGMYGSVQ